MEVDLVCNHKRCRKRLGKYAWVTSCSHIFCDEDGTREFSKSTTHACPACETVLSDKQEIVRVDLQPSDQYKSMVLAGQRPEVVMEICSRAISFWSYQAYYERTYQEYIASHAKEKCSQLQQYYEQALSRSQTELQSLKQQVQGTKKEIEEEKKRSNDVSEKLMEKSRQYQKLQAMYDSLRRRAITPGTFGSTDEPRARQQPPPSTRFDMPLGVQPAPFPADYSGYEKQPTGGSHTFDNMALHEPSEAFSFQADSSKSRKDISAKLSSPSGIPPQLVHGHAARPSGKFALNHHILATPAGMGQPIIPPRKI
eukprot:m.27682 g.27682  ORF g.27682 m.27682 type:complete len:311 (+) comp30276_c0_seq1:75-1007(+)